MDSAHGNANESSVKAPAARAASSSASATPTAATPAPKHCAVIVSEMMLPYATHDRQRVGASISLAFLPVLLYNSLGFELMSSAGDEMKDPQRDVSKLSLVTGTWDALAVPGRQWGAWGDALSLALGIGFLYACVANVVTWALGANRVAAAAAADGALPEPLGRLHPRHHTPHVAFVVMGLVASVLLVGNALLGSGSSNVFWMLFKLSGLCFLFTCLPVFPAFWRLRVRRGEQPRPYRLPGGDAVAMGAAALCFLFIAGACVLFFRPSPDADPARAAQETLLLAGECLATLVVGLWLLPRASGEPKR